jgi:uridylate kinase
MEVMTPERPKWKRILLKLSGESFAGGKPFGIDAATVDRLAGEIKDVHDCGIEIAIVIGGGNIIRGGEASKAGIDRATADNMGMLGTVINALALQDALEKKGVITRAMTAIEMAEIAEPFIRRRAIRHLEKDLVVILAAGTGNPYFSTDTAAVLRGLEIHAEAVLKATNVDGVYDRDPKKYPDATKFEHMSYSEAINLGVKVMDMTAFTLCKENNMPIVVFDVHEPGAIKRVALGEQIGTYVGRDDSDL